MATQQQNEQLQQLKDFLKVATTRGGAPFTITKIQKDIQGNVTTLKGSITVEGKTIPMYWNTVGTSFASGGNPEFDLVQEMSFEELMGEDSSVE